MWGVHRAWKGSPGGGTEREGGQGQRVRVAERSPDTRYFCISAFIQHVYLRTSDGPAPSGGDGKASTSQTDEG